MAYEDRLYVATCPGCESRWLFKPKGANANDPAVPKKFTCDNCSAVNTIRPKERHPNLPAEVFLGHEIHDQVRLMPFPPGQRLTEWAYPYSIRSFIAQMSSESGSCHFSVRLSDTVFGEKIFRDTCSDDELGPWEEGRACHITSGFTRQAKTCPLLERVSLLCQTQPESRFLWAYLHLARSKSFPMLLPQSRVGFTGRRRPDFIAFVPTQHLVYRRYAIELDGAHTTEHKEKDAMRDFDLESEGFEVISLRPGERGYFEEVRTLVERFAQEMELASEAPFDYATTIEVSSSVSAVKFTDDDLPF